MNYKKIMQKIFAELSMYKSEIDKLASDYQSEHGKFDEEMEAAKGKYTESFIAESRANWKPQLDYAGLVNMARETHSKNVTRCITQLEQYLNDYFRAPADANFCATLTAIKALGVNLSNREFSLLQESANGYVGRRLLNELAVTRTKTEQVAELKDGEVTRAEKEKAVPCTSVNLPDIEKVYEGLQNVKNAVDTAFAYCGANYELKDIIFPPSKATEETNARIEAVYGAKVQPQKLDNLTIARMSSSIKCLNENYDSYTAFSEMMGELSATMPEPKGKTTLTESDKKLIDIMIEPQYPALAASKAVEIAKSDERLAEILRLDSRYSQEVRKALGEEVSNE